MDLNSDPNLPPRPRTEIPPAPRSINLDRLFLHRRGQLTWDQMTSFNGGPRRQGSRLILWSLMAVSIDTLILLSLSCLFLIAFAFIVHTPIGGVMRSAGGLGLRQMFLPIFLVSCWTYMVVLRVFFGFSIGEWACDLRLGQPSQRRHPTYLFKVALRATVLVATGVVTLPLLSLILGHDLPGRLSGVRLISLK